MLCHANRNDCTIYQSMPQVPLVCLLGLASDEVGISSPWKIPRAQASSGPQFLIERLFQQTANYMPTVKFRQRKVCLGQFMFALETSLAPERELASWHLPHYAATSKNHNPGVHTGFAQRLTRWWHVQYAERPNRESLLRCP